MEKCRKWFGGYTHPLYAGAALFIGLILWFLAGGMRPMAVGFFILTGAILFYYAVRLVKRRAPKLGRTAEKIFTYALSIFLIAFAATEVMLVNGSRSTAEVDARYLIVPGAYVVGTEPSGVLTDRLEAARDYLNAYPDAVAVVCGGRGEGEDITEARCMADWLTGAGIAPDRILTEEESTSTKENIRNAAALIEAREGSVQGLTVTVLTSEFHLMRCELVARDAGFDVRGVAAVSANKAVLVSNYMREALALWKYQIVR